MDKAHEIPEPDHPITITPNARRVTVKVGDTVIVDTTHALVLKEASYPAVQYVPRADVDMDKLVRTEHSSYCPYKGDASYFSILGAARGENAIWTYETPFPEVAAIREHLAFYADRVQISEQ